MTTDLKALWTEAFGDPESFVEGFFQKGFSPERHRYIYAQDQLACALYWFDVFVDGRKLAYIYAVATAKNMRGQGYCRRLMQHTHQQLKREGYSGAVLVPGSESLFAFYEKIGYQVCSYISEYTCEATTPIHAQPMSPTQYAACRKSLLPVGGVLQEGPCLTFLNTYCQFWQGDSWLLAGYVDKDTLYVQELLGDPAIAPAITATLGAKKGRFRGPGKDRPFAMYYPLDDSPPPKYFGLALD